MIRRSGQVFGSVLVNDRRGLGTGLDDEPVTTAKKTAPKRAAKKTAAPKSDAPADDKKEADDGDNDLHG